MSCYIFYSESNTMLKKSQVVSLREKVGKLSRENKDLSAKLTYFTASKPDSSKMLELEQETEELKATVKDLLQRVSHVVSK